MYGYSGRIIWVDLSGSVRIDEVRERDARMFVGGRGLGLKLVMDMGLDVDAVNPYGPENPFILATGPLGGTRIPLATRAAAIFKSPLTNRWSYSTVGGTLGAYMKYSGVDVVVIRGVSAKPIHLIVGDGKVEIKDAGDLWGLDTVETEHAIKREFRDAAVLTIGPAGENGVPYACIGHEEWRQFGRTGAGAVMGSKRIKAITFVPTNKAVQVASDEAYHELVKEFGRLAVANPGMVAYRQGGTVRLIDVGNGMGFFPSIYWTKVVMPHWEDISWEKSLRTNYFIKNGACLYCPVACHKVVKSSGGEYDLEYETVMALGGLTGISDPREVIDLAELADRLGFDTVSLGNSVALLMYLGERGLVRGAPSWGDYVGVRQLIIDTAHRRGLGKLVSLGVKALAEELGVPDLAIHVKGLEPAAYDPRTLKGMALNNSISERGADHLWSSAYAIDIAGQGGGRFAVGEEKIRAIMDVEERNALYDSLLLCKFGRAIYSWDAIRNALNAVTGMGYTNDELRNVARRIIVLHRYLNKTTMKQDRLPPRWLREPVEYEGKQYVVAEEEWSYMVRKYYELRGYDEEGKPRRETLEELGLPSEETKTP
ncbi:aldehyde ferredoxin oxidoreductase [Thermocladium modestius]|uniref:Aldehyde ferredoxin oxidoreductase n=1 Tax=Thermocladium modestius TaxID=62609 RepID=A0A830GSC6_9CREN|nr:aldehyde ferredoxin oxidoreductase family protein [Thermocladium modestius]GGP20082.1 aldehyde ferredoxin oxidoreductase [Thermocladium modestius]